MIVAMRNTIGKILRKFREQGLEGVLLRESTGMMMVQLSSLGLSFVMSIVLARVMSNEHFGIYTYVNYWSWLFSLVLIGQSCALFQFIKVKER
jgi:O-antigen/teichoic acid export membrane protein